MVKAEPKHGSGTVGAVSDDRLLSLIAAFTTRCGGQVNHGTALVRLGASSLEFMELLARLEEQCASDLDDIDLAQCQTVGDLIDALRRRH